MGPTLPTGLIAADRGIADTDSPARSATELPGPAHPVRLLDRVRHAIRTLPYSYRTEQAYVDWTRRFILFTASATPTNSAHAKWPIS
jgi:hypothetical protein